jgi:hypothetical protein
MDTHKNKREWWEWIVIAVAIALMIIGLSSCKQIQYVPVEKIVTKDSVIIKTEYVNKETKVKEYVAGDTVYHDSIVFCTILRTDTIYKTERDSIPYPVKVVKEVERSLNSYEKTMIRLGWCLIGLIIAIVGCKVFKLYGK